LAEKHFDCGSTARLFYCAKASAADRDAGLEFEKLRPMARSNGAQSALSDDETYTGGSTDIGLNKVQMRANHHPTVKPTTLMRWLVRLVTPTGGRCVDPMMGSGSTGRACALEDLEFVGIEREPAYFELAKRRIAEAQGELFAKRD
jgi:site-specific DNA-methyltransferase (adenine-specific)